MLAEDVYALTRQIPEGRVSTYGEIAKALGDAVASRAVGWILNRNPELVKTPCHRVIYSDGQVGGYAAGISEKIRLLEKEGISVVNEKVKGFEKKIFKNFDGSKPLMKLRREEEILKKKIVLKDSLGFPETVCGVDVYYYRSNPEKACAAAVVFDAETKKMIESKIVETEVFFPYIPTYFSYREGPVILEVLNSLETQPDVTLIDGNGILHPRGFGLASYVGVKVALPTIGVAKKLLCGKVKGRLTKPGDAAEIIYDGRTVGFALKSNVKSKNLIYVSPGHKTSPKAAVAFVKKFTVHRIPEPIRQAHMLTRK